MPPALGVWHSLESTCGTASSDGSRTSRMSEGLGSLRGSTTWSLQDGTEGQEGCYSTAPAPSHHLPTPFQPVLPLGARLGMPQIPTLSQQWAATGQQSSSPVPW